MRNTRLYRAASANPEHTGLVPRGRAKATGLLAHFAYPPGGGGRQITLSPAGELPVGRNLICLDRCSIRKTLASANADRIHTGEQQDLGTCGQSSGTFWSHLPSALHCTP